MGSRPEARGVRLQASRTRRRRSSRSVDPAGVASSSPRSASRASRAASGARARLRRDGPGRGEGIHLHHRRRSIHVSPASETRTSKRLRPGLSWRSGVIQTNEGVDQAGAAGARRLLRHPADAPLGDPEPDLVAVGGRTRPRTRRFRSVPGWGRARAGFSPRHRPQRRGRGVESDQVALEHGRLDAVIAGLLLVGLAAADGDEDPVAVGRVGDVGPAEGAHLAPAHPGHEARGGTCGS